MSDAPEELNPSEIDMILEAAAGKPLKRSAAQGITDMNERIRFLKEQKAACLNLLADSTLSSSRAQALGDELSSINDDIATAETRLADYQLQARSLN